MHIYVLYFIQELYNRSILLESLDIKHFFIALSITNIFFILLYWFLKNWLDILESNDNRGDEIKRNKK